MPQQQHGTSAACLLWRITYQILRQSRPFLRRWTASSSGWSSPPRRRRRQLPPAAVRLAATEVPRDKGQHSAATADNTACRQTSESRMMLHFKQPPQHQHPRVTAPERDARCVGTLQRQGALRLSSAIGWVMSRSKLLSDSIGWYCYVGEPWVTTDRQQQFHEKLNAFNNVHYLV